MNPDDKIDGIDMVLLRLKIGVFEDVCDRFEKTLTSPDALLRYAEELTNWLCAPVATHDVAGTVFALDGLCGDLEDRVGTLEDALTSVAKQMTDAGNLLVEVVSDIKSLRSDPLEKQNPAASAEGREAAPGAPLPVILREQSGSADWSDVNPQGGVVVPDTRQPAVGVEPQPQDSKTTDGGQHEEIDVAVTSQKQEPQKSTTPPSVKTFTVAGIKTDVPLQKHSAIDGGPVSPAAKPDPAELRGRFWKLIEASGTEGVTHAYPVVTHDH